MSVFISRHFGFFTVFEGVGSTRHDVRSSMTAVSSIEPSGDRQMEDGKLVARMARGDKLACADLYDRFSRPLYSVALRILNDRPEAEDVIQETFLSLWENASRFEADRGSAFGWAVTFTRNRAIDRLRTRVRRTTLLNESAVEDLPGGNAAADGDSGDDLMFKEKTGAVRAALLTLPPDQVRALELAFFSGLTQQEIAAKLSEPLGTIKARIRRGLLKLRDTLTRRHD